MQYSVIDKESFNFQQHTRFMFVSSKMLMSPLEAMYGLLVYILYKDLNASAFQIVLLISLRPIVALLSFYGNLIIKDRPHNLKTLILGANIISLVPCFLFPFVESIWFFLISYALFMTSLRAVIPAWSEILKINVSPDHRGRIFSQASSAHYIVNMLIPLFVAPLIDAYPPLWKWTFFVLGLVNVLTIILTLCIQIKDQPTKLIEQPAPPHSLPWLLLKPWKDSWTLMRERVDFRKFQIVFLFGGAGLMVMQPALPVFFKELELSYTQVTLAMSLCKGIAFAMTSQMWASWMNRIPIHLFNSYVTAFATIFAILMMSSVYSMYGIYVAYLVYGTMQAGSELSWNLSGPIFAKDRDSTLFTGINVAMVGLRGCIAPFLGGILLNYTNPLAAFAFGGGLCLIASVYSFYLNKSTEIEQRVLT